MRYRILSGFLAASSCTSDPSKAPLHWKLWSAEIQLSPPVSSELAPRFHLPQLAPPWLWPVSAEAPLQSSQQEGPCPALSSFLLLSSALAEQTPFPSLWADWQPYLGTWQGTGPGGSGQGFGEFTLTPELNGAVVARHNFAAYPATKDKPTFRHDGLIIIYHDGDSHTRADYRDTEGPRHPPRCQPVSRKGRFPE